eukprot:17439-Heterococcus_DN1.PRE.3
MHLVHMLCAFAGVLARDPIVQKCSARSGKETQLYRLLSSETTAPASAALEPPRGRHCRLAMCPFEFDHGCFKLCGQTE